MFKNLIKLATGALGGIQTYLIVGAVMAALGLAGGFYSGYRWQAGVVANLKLAQAKAVDKADRDAFERGRKIGAANDKHGAHDVTVQTKIVNHYITLTERIPYYVTQAQDSNGGCLSVGFARVLVAAQRDVGPETLQLPAGVTDDACTGYTLSTLAAALAPSFRNSNQNSAQLNELEASVRDNDQIMAAPSGQ